MKINEFTKCPLTKLEVVNQEYKTVCHYGIDTKFYKVYFENDIHQMSLCPGLEKILTLSKTDYQQNIEVKEKLDNYLPLFMSEMMKDNLSQLFNKTIHWDCSLSNRPNPRESDLNIKPMIDSLIESRSYPKTPRERLNSILKYLIDNHEYDGQKFRIANNQKFVWMFQMKNKNELEFYLKKLVASNDIEISGDYVNLSFDAIMRNSELRAETINDNSKLINKVFISHSSTDKAFAKKLKDYLEKNKINTWYDFKDLEVGDVLSDQISKGINECGFFLIVISENSIKSNWVKNELDEAYDGIINESKRILPCIYGNIKDDNIPLRLRKHLYADFRSNSGNSPFEMVIRSIKKYLG